MHWKLKTKPVEFFKENPSNPRNLSKKQFEDLKKSLNRFGQCEPLVSQPDGTLIGGHQRLRVLKDIGRTEVDVYIPEKPLTEKQLQELTIRLNKNTGSWDEDMLANAFESEDLAEWGFTDQELFIDPKDPEPPQSFTITIKCTSEENLRETEKALEDLSVLYDFSYKARIK